MFNYRNDGFLDMHQQALIVSLSPHNQAIVVPASAAPRPVLILLYKRLSEMLMWLVFHCDLIGHSLEKGSVDFITIATALSNDFESLPLLLLSSWVSIKAALMNNF